MKKKTSWRTFAGLAAAAAAFLRLSEDAQIHDLIPPPTKREPFVAVVPPTYRPPKPFCGFYEKAVYEYITELNTYAWRCVRDPTIPRKPGR